MFYFFEKVIDTCDKRETNRRDLLIRRWFYAYAICWPLTMLDPLNASSSSFTIARHLFVCLFFFSATTIITWNSLFSLFSIFVLIATWSAVWHIWFYLEFYWSELVEHFGMGRGLSIDCVQSKRIELAGKACRQLFSVKNYYFYLVQSLNS